VGDDAIAAILSSADVIDAMLGTVEHAPGSPSAARLWGMINEDLILVQLFFQRMRTPAFLSWVGLDGVLLRDVSQPTELLRQFLTCAVRKLCGDFGTRP